MSAPLSSRSDLPCRLCGAPTEGPFQARELMYGLRHGFDYVRCLDCGVLQIARYPDNLGDYYPRDYYSMSDGGGGRLRALLGRLPGSAVLADRAERWLRGQRTRHEIGRFSPLGAFVTRWRGERPKYARLRPVGLTAASAVLEIGCGDGTLLRALRDAGVSGVEGVDPFAPDSARAQPGLPIHHSLADVTRQFDVVLLADSLEHMPDQPGVFAELRRVCKPQGWVCIAVPVLARAWQTYGTDWVQLDAPRHLYLHTVSSLRRLAEARGFVVRDVRFDSTGFQFWGSEQFRRDVPLVDPSSHAVNPQAHLFSAAEMASWEQEAQHLNACAQGDHAVFYLQPL